MRIVFSGDFLRPAPSAWRPTQHYNIRWLHDLFALPLLRLGVSDVSYLAWENAGVCRGGLTDAQVRDFYLAAGLPPNILSWASLYDSRFLPTQLRHFVASRLGDALVIGFELPPSLKRLLHQLRIPFIDFVIHPVRFHDDIFFGIQACAAAGGAVLADWALEEEELYLAAGVVRATAGRLANIAMAPDTTLFLAQTQHDKSQIRRGHFIGPMDFLVQALNDGLLPQPLAVKPHPFELRNPHVMGLVAAMPCRLYENESFYALLAHESLRQVVSLSSSTSVEAPYFGKPASFLYQAPLQLAYRGQQQADTMDGYMSVKDAYFSPRFWYELLRSLGATNLSEPARPAHLPPKPNRLRTALKSFWDFNKVDTDIAVALRDGNR